MSERKLSGTKKVVAMALLAERQDALGRFTAKWQPGAKADEHAYGVDCESCDFAKDLRRLLAAERALGRS